MVTKFEKSVRAAEKTAAPGIEEAIESLATAAAAVPVARGELQQAEALVHAIESGWTRLSDQHSPADHAEAVSSVKRATLRIRGAKRIRDAAERAPRNTDTLLADVVARVLRKAFHGTNVPVLSTFVPIPKDSPDATEKPLVLVSQTAIAERSDLGLQRGSVDVRFFRTPMHRGLTTRMVEDAARALGEKVDVSFVRSNDIDGYDEARIIVRAAHAAVPEIVGPIAPIRFQMVGGMVAASIAESTAVGGARVETSTGGAFYRTRHALTAPSGHVVVEEQETDGKRKIVLDVSVLAEPLGALPPGVDLTAAATEAVADLDGHFFPALGVVASAELLGRDGHPLAVDRSAAASTLSRIADVKRDASTLGFESVRQSIIRVELVSEVVEAAAQVDDEEYWDDIDLDRDGLGLKDDD